MPRACTQGEPREQARVATAVAVEEVRRRDAGTHECDVQVDAVPDADDVAQQPAVPVDPVERRVCHEAYHSTPK